MPGALLDGFGFTGYRSFGTSELQRIEPMTKVHLLAGPNNSGKSNVLKIAQSALPSLRSGARLDFASVDAPLSPESGVDGIRLTIARRLSDEQLGATSPVGVEILRRVLKGPGVEPEDDDLYWFEFRLLSGTDGKPSHWEPSAEHLEVLALGADAAEPGGRLLGALSSKMTGSPGGVSQATTLAESPPG